MKTTKTVKNLKSLCNYFFARDPKELNRILYSSTNCGASISLHLGTVKEEVLSCSIMFFETSDGKSQYDKLIIDSMIFFHNVFENIEDIPEDIRNFFCMQECNEDKILPEKLGFETLCEAVKKRLGKTLHNGKIFLKDCSIEENVLQVNFNYNKIEDKSYWVHNGDDRVISIKEPLIGFTIQTIVEGSDVNVDSDEFMVPVKTSEINKWVQHMEEEASFYWKRDNNMHLRIKGPNDVVLYCDYGWNGNLEDMSEEELFTEELKTAIIQLVNDQVNFQNNTEYKLPGHKGWIVESFISDLVF